MRAAEYSRPRALGGAELVGEHMTRFVYLDEAGISNLDQEPWCVVAGFILHADGQWKGLDRYLGDMIDDIFPDGPPEDFYFRGYDLWSGCKGGHFPSPQNGGRFTGADRWKILEQLVSIPVTYALPIVFGAVDRREHVFRHPRHGDGVNPQSPADEVIAEQASCYFQCAIQAERIMREHAQPDEVAILIAEHGPANKPVKELHNWMRKRASVANVVNDPELASEWTTLLPLERIVETAHFANKLDSLPLQLADICAFIIKRHMCGKKNSEPLYQRLTEVMLSRPVSDFSAEPSLSAGDAQE